MVDLTKYTFYKFTPPGTFLFNIIFIDSQEWLIRKHSLETYWLCLLTQEKGGNKQNKVVCPQIDQVVIKSFIQWAPLKF
jgi:hypothetical protein